MTSSFLQMKGVLDPNKYLLTLYIYENIYYDKAQYYLPVFDSVKRYWSSNATSKYRS